MAAGEGLDRASKEGGAASGRRGRRRGVARKGGGGEASSGAGQDFPTKVRLLSEDQNRHRRSVDSERKVKEKKTVMIVHQDSA